MTHVEDHAVKLDTLIVCDDIRREDNGKLFVIGMYPSNIGVPKMPSVLNLCLFTTFKPIKNGKAQITIEIRNSWSDKKLVAKTEIESNTATEAFDSYIAVLPNMLLQVEKAGEISIYLKFDDAEWELVKQYPVNITNVVPSLTTAPTAPLPSS